MSRKRSRSKENGFLAIPYSWTKLLGHNTRLARKPSALEHCGTETEWYLLMASVKTQT